MTIAKRIDPKNKVPLFHSFAKAILKGISKRRAQIGLCRWVALMDNPKKLILNPPVKMMNGISNR
jgi:hypothetical protein